MNSFAGDDPAAAAVQASLTVLILAGNVVAAMILLTAWWGASREVSEAGQLLWMDLGVVGVLAGALANAAALIRLRRAVGQARGRLLRPGLTQQPMADTEAARTRPHAPVAVAGLLRFHVASCSLVQGKYPEPVAPAALAELLPCGVCEP